MSKNNSEIQVGQLNVYFYFIIILCNNWLVIFPQIKTDHRQKYLIYMILVRLSTQLPVLYKSASNKCVRESILGSVVRGLVFEAGHCKFF